MDVFIILKVMIISQMCMHTYVKTSNCKFEMIAVSECQLNLNKAVKHKQIYRLQQATGET